LNTRALTDSPAPPERRYAQRRKLQTRIEIEWGSAVLTGTVQNIGPAGMFIDLMPPLWLGATFMARLLVKPVLVLDCKVTRVEPDQGIAITFTIPEESGKAQLAALLASLPPL
jgi:PilZ domain